MINSVTLSTLKINGLGNRQAEDYANETAERDAGPTIRKLSAIHALLHEGRLSAEEWLHACREVFGVNWESHPDTEREDRPVIRQYPDPV